MFFIKTLYTGMDQVLPVLNVGVGSLLLLSVNNYPATRGKRNALLGLCPDHY